MFCPKCNTNLTGEEVFCPNCGENIKATQSPEQSEKMTTAEIISAKSNNFIKTSLSKFKAFILKYKKQTIASLICVVAISISLIFYNAFFGFVSLKWDESYENFSLEYIIRGTVELGVKFSDPDKIEDLKYSSTCGEVKQKDLAFTWDLTEGLGECEILVQYKHRELKKKFTVIALDDEDKELSLEYEIDTDSDEDLDLDGLTNKQEKEYGTNPEMSDSDMDGLDDNMAF